MARLHTLCLLLLLLLTSKVYAQTPTDKTGYKDFVIADKNILLLSKDGTLKLIPQEADKQKSTIDTDAPIVAIDVDSKGNIVAADTDSLIKTYDTRQQTWRVFTSYDDKLSSILFNSHNQCFLITNKGIVDVATNTTYFPDSSFSKNHQVHYRPNQGWFGLPVCYMDRHDNIWLGFDHGEWGGDVFVFNTSNRAFTPVKIDSVQMTMNPVSAFCEDQQSVYMSGGLSHMFLTHGSIIKFQDGTGRPMLLSKDRKTPVEAEFIDLTTGKKRMQSGTTWKVGQMIGPSAYNPANNCLYFYSQNGFYKGDIRTDLSDIKNWQNILKPKLTWTGGRANAVGPAINVLKMQFTANDKLFFLTEHEGLGIYDGKNVRFIR